ncbi:MAG TPA: response regulator [Verrucomicrobiae bacterium]|jgi:signal transduction histidine kinase|nr:response regulator [Verrucomicrobiae bacterium]
MGIPLNVLIVEDSADDAELLLDELHNAGFAPAWKRVETEATYCASLSERIDIIFSDFSLPQFSTFRALELLQKSNFDVPFVVVSGTLGEERAVDILKAGATDYVLKNHLSRLGPVVQRALRESAERIERRKLHEQFLQAQKMESIGQLAGGVAHDFNNLLTVIQGHASMLRAKPELPEEIIGSINQILLAAERATNLTRQLLTFSRKQATQTRVLDLNEVVANLTKMLKHILRADVSLRVDYGSESFLIRADAGMMEQVLMNLAINARDAMPQGGKLIIATSDECIGPEYVQLNPQGSVGDFVCLSVTDTGEGIPPENLSRIFEPFFTTKPVGQGTGLGLATVYGIVRQHNGWLTVYSEVGKGTVFRIYLPAAKEREDKKIERSVNHEVRGGNETILLIEDEAPLRALDRSILEGYGYEVVEADSAGAAMERWQEHCDRISLVFTDIVIPGGANGPELAKKFHAEKPSLRVIFSSGYSMDVVEKDFELREGINFLQKPYSPHRLAQTVRDVLEQ